VNGIDVSRKEERILTYLHMHAICVNMYEFITGGTGYTSRNRLPHSGPVLLDLLFRWPWIELYYCALIR
jgi:hypothetical protein